MQVRCPQCQTTVELTSDGKLSDIVCPSCGSGFSLLGTEETLPLDGDAKTIGHFDLVEQVGIGSFGAVWKARDSELDRMVAVKIPRKGQLDVDETEQFLREARAAAQLRHPSIVTVYEVGREQDTVFIVSDFIEGVTLADRLTAQRFSVREAAELCAKIADALQHAHEQGIVHRDLKPGNIILDVDGNPHIMDFGLARREAGEVTMTVEGRVLGTPAYMSPEQAKGSAHTADGRSDVYSLGVILFELLTGERPFRGNIRMLVHQVINDEPPSPRRLNGAVPRDLETIVLKCLEKEAGKRYATAKALADDLRRFVTDKPIAGRPVSRFERGWRWCKRFPVTAVLSATVAILLIGIAAASTLFGISSSSTARRLKEQSYRDRMNLAYQALNEGNRLQLERLLGDLLPRNAGETPEFELRYLWARYQAMSQSVTAEEIPVPASVSQLSYSPDGRYLSISCVNKEIVVFDCVRKKPVSLPASFRGSHATFSGLGNYLTACSTPTVNQAISIENAQIPRILRADSFEEVSLPILSSLTVAAVALSPDELTVACARPEGFIEFRDFSTCKVVWQTTPIALSKVTSLTWSPDSRFLAVTGDPSVIKVWEVPRQSEIDVLVSPEYVARVAFSPDSKKLLVGSAFGGTLLMVHGEAFVSSGIEVPGDITAASFSQDEKWLALGSADFKVRIWDTVEDRPVNELLQLEFVSAVCARTITIG